MEQAKRILKRIFCLPLVPTVLIAVPAFALVIYVLTEDLQGPLSYLSYIASAYALVISVIWFVRGGKTIRDKAKQHPLIGRYLKDSKYRTRISLYQGLLINLLYITVKFGIWHLLPLLVVCHPGNLLCSAGSHAVSADMALGWNQAGGGAAQVSPVRDHAAAHE